MYQFLILIVLALWRYTEATDYHFAKEKMKFDAAVSYCSSQNLQLVQIENKEHNTLVFNLAKGKNFGDYWINGNDKDKEGVYVNTGKEKLTYTNWHSKQPDNINNEDCIHVIKNEDGLWNDLNCDTQLNVICQPMKTATDYHFAKEKMKFDAAVSYCSSQNLQLVQIENKEHNTLVFNLAKGKNFGDYWINGNDKDKEGVYVNTGKEKLTYTNWHSKQPDNIYNEDCIHVIKNEDGLWNDLNCDTQLNVICQPMKTTTDYHFAKDKMKFDAAVSYCSSQNLQLVQIENKEHNTLVYNLAKGKNFGDYWINGNDKDKEGVYVTTGNEKLTYTNWHSKQPDNINNEDCIHVIKNDDGLWNDLNCDNQLNVICHPIENKSDGQC